MASGGYGEDPRLKFTKSMIRSVLMSVKEGVLASRFLSDYRGITCENIPYKTLGYSTLEEFINSMPDVVLVRTVRGELTYFAVADEATQHIHDLIAKQKTAPKKSKPMKKIVSRFPRHHSHGIRAFSPRPLRPDFLVTQRHVSTYRSAFSDSPQYFTPPKARYPILPTPSFNLSELSPLTVTVGGDSSTIHRRIITGRQISQEGKDAIKAALSQKSPSSRKASSYQIPPRFQKQHSAADRPVAGKIV